MSEEMITRVSIKSNEPNWNPIYNSIQVGPDDGGAGSYLKIIREDETKGRGINLEWEEWDTIVKVVEKYRKDWEWE